MRMRKTARLLGFAGCLGGLAFGGGCSNDALPKKFKLGGLRVLALQANTPEIGVGGSAVITPLVSDLDGAGRTVTFTAESCLDPGVSLGVTPTCEGSSSRVVIATNTVTFSDTRRTGTAPTFTVTPPATILDGRSPIEQFNGVPYLVTYTLTAGTETETSFRRVVVSTRGASDRNTNPDISGASVDGVSLNAVPTVAASVRPEVAAGAEQSYVALNSSGSPVSQSEAVSISWYLSLGTFQSSRTDLDDLLGFTPPTETSTNPSFFILVIRDDRGGVDFVGVPAL
jgi:hypothetical protein